jgi:hypothetical protein
MYEGENPFFLTQKLLGFFLGKKKKKANTTHKTRENI